MGAFAPHLTCRSAGDPRSRASRAVRGLTGAVLLAVLLAFVAVLLAPPVHAQAKSWTIDSMDVVLDVLKDSDILVSETVTFNFEGSYSYVGRVIPTRNLEYLKDIKVFQNGVQLPQGSGPGTYDVFNEGGNRVIQLNFALTDARATWTIEYRAQGAIFYFDEGDELRWYVLDADTPVPIGRVTATVKLPGDVSPDQLFPALQTGPSVETDVARPGGGTVVFEGIGLPAYTNFWTVTGFPKGVVDFKWTIKRVFSWIVPKVGFALPIAAFLIMLLMWRRRGRDEPAAVHATYVSEPPSDLPPGVAGALIDESVDIREVTATIVDLARRGYFDMIEDKVGGLAGIFGASVTTFRKLKPFEDLQGFERKVADSLFAGHGDTVTSKDLKDKFYVHMAPIIDEIYNSVTRRKLFVDNPQKVRAKWVGYSVLLTVLLGVLITIMIMTDIPGWGYFLFGSIVTVVIVFAFGRAMPQRTALGAEEQRKWEAFRNYLRDLRRFDDMETARAAFEKYLPYAIAFGVEKDWVRRFKDVQVPPPTWYHPVFVPGYASWASGNRPGSPTAMGGPAGGMPAGGGLPGGGFNLDSISNSLFGSLNNISSTLTSSPKSSGSSSGGGGGGFGGGFSGGGGGGGFRAG